MTNGQTDARWWCAPATAPARASARSIRSRRELGDDDPGAEGRGAVQSADMIGLMAAAVRDEDPVIFFEHKSLYATKAEVPDGEILDTLGTAKGCCGPARTRRSCARPDGAARARRGGTA